MKKDLDNWKGGGYFCGMEQSGDKTDIKIGRIDGGFFIRSINVIGMSTENLDKLEKSIPIMVDSINGLIDLLNISKFSTEISSSVIDEFIADICSNFNTRKDFDGCLDLLKSQGSFVRRSLLEKIIRDSSLINYKNWYNLTNDIHFGRSYLIDEQRKILTTVMILEVELQFNSLCFHLVSDLVPIIISHYKKDLEYLENLIKFC